MYESRFWTAACVGVFYPVTALLGRRRLDGLEHVPTSGPAILVCNHISYIDPLYTSVFVHRRGRLPRFLAKSTLWSVPVVRRTLVGMRQIPVYRESREAGLSLRAAAQAIDEDALVLIYPEGTITRDPDGWPMQGRTGVARLALDHDVPVIPVVHWGTHRIYDHYGKRFRPLPRTEVVVRAGPPVDVSAYREKPVEPGMLRDLTDHLMGAVRDLLAEVRDETPPKEFFVREGEP